MSTVRTNKIEIVPGSSQTALTLPMYTQVDQLYSFSGTALFDTIQNNGWYQPINYNAAIKRYANLGPGSTFGPNSSTATPHNANPASVNAATWCADKELFNVIAGCQLWRVPITATYTLTARGAGRNATYAGYGRDLTCDFKLYAGEWLRIVCGAQGETNGSNFGGGNGATCFSVFRHGLHMPLLIAGGGAGLSGNSPQSDNSNRDGALPMTDPGDDTTYSGTGQQSARDGMGGRGSYYSYDYSSPITHWAGGGGGGWGTPGGNGTIGQNSPGEHNSGGAALSSACPHGGYYPDAQNAYHGGFGGGGATGISSGSAGGGGGWYGGNATYAFTNNTSDDSTALGGGSYSANTGWVNNGVRNSYGQAEVSL